MKSIKSSIGSSSTSIENGLPSGPAPELAPPGGAAGGTPCCAGAGASSPRPGAGGTA
ncbi:MAG TPA: hypothetical protein VFS43_45850 [Polyangiaceae bacterium]|nr:hypothetical protein [Polyangiaceae bacterium]